MSIDIPSEYLPFVQKAIASGRYASEGAVLEAALGLLKQRYDSLREDVQRGFDEVDRGECHELASDEELHKFFEDLKREASAELPSRETV
jgi:putative addiction module CopG family antidote